MTGRRRARSPIQPCEQERAITGRFDRLVAKCGDRVYLIASGTNIPDGSATSFRIRRYERGAGVAREQDTMNRNLVARHPWVLKKNFRGWNPPTIDFRVSAAGVSGDSTNRLRIYKYNDFASYTKTMRMTSGRFGWDAGYDVEFKNSVLLITIKIKLINRQGRKPAAGEAMPAAGSAVSRRQKRRMRRDIESKLTRKWVLHRDQCLRGATCNCRINRKCCKFLVDVRVRFVESGQHHIVNLFRGRGQANATNWTRVKTRANSWAHETGHLLGYYDEYPTGATGSAPWIANRPLAIMGTGLQVPKHYYNGFKGEFRLKTSEPWELIN